MRFILALVAFLLGGMLIAVGLAEQTVLKPADHVTAAASVPAKSTYVTLSASALRSHDGAQKVEVKASAPVWMGYGTTADVQGWLAGSSYATGKVKSDGSLSFSSVKASGITLDTTQHDPSGSDLWLSECTSSSCNLNVPEGMTLLITSNSGMGSISAVSVRWPIRAETPLSGSMILLGLLLALVGVLLLVWAIIHVRSIMRGPHTTGISHRIRKLIAGGLAAILALVAAFFGSSSADAVAMPQASVTEQQAHTILSRVANTISTADAFRSDTLLATRMTGPALQLRESTYKIQSEDATAATLQSIPLDGTLQLLLPQATDSWPRTLFAVVSDPDGKSLPVSVTMVQASARENYKVLYATTLQAGAKLPSLPSTVSGTDLLGLQSTKLQEQPLNIAADYGMLLRDSQAKSAAKFDTDSDFLLASVGESAKQEAAREVGKTAKIAFSDLPSDSSTTIVLAASDESALVAVQLQEKWVVTPRKKGVTVKPSGATEILSKTPSTSKGIEAVYGYQLLFSVPLKASGGLSTLLGYSQGLVSASEVK